jgi:aromatic-L-amino-acid/L-tryptophan decarboxylase
MSWPTGAFDVTSLLFDSSEHANASVLTSRFIEDYLATVMDRPVYPDIDRGALRALLTAPIPETPTTLDALFAELNSVVVPNSTHTAHPRFLPYVQASPNGISPYAEAVAATFNQNCNLWALSPSANAIEQCVVRWLSELVGARAAGGLITSGGSVANLIGLTAARDHALGTGARADGLQGRQSPLTLYASEEVHSSIDKAVAQLGLGVRHLRKIPTDERFQLRMDLLRSRIAQDRKDGCSPFCVVASAGTVTTGSVDPLDAIAAFCAEQDLWLHVDGAYGALSAMSDRFKGPLQGLQHANSISLDPHKFLFTSFEAGCVLVKSLAALEHSYKVMPSYLAKESDPDFVNFSDFGPQLSRSFKALKIWWSLRYFGKAAYVAAVERMSDLAQYMGRLASSASDFELVAPVTFNAVCFRVATLDDDANRRVLRRLVEGGTAFLGPATVKGRFAMRACFMNLRTRPADVESIMQDILRLSRD